MNSVLDAQSEAHTTDSYSEYKYAAFGGKGIANATNTFRKTGRFTNHARKYPPYDLLLRTKSITLRVFSTDIN